MSSEFKAFEIDGESGFSEKQESYSEDFRISKNLSQAIVENPGLQEVLEEEVAKRVEARLKTDNSAKLQEFYEAAKTAGREAGLEKAQVEMEIFRDKLRTIGHEILVQKQALLEDHEEQWCHALKSVLEKCFTSRASSFVKDVSEWLSENVNDKKNEERMTVFVSAAEYEAFKKEWELTSGQGIQFESDSALNEGEVRFQSDAGEVFFSPTGVLQKLDEIIANHFQKDNT